MRRVIVILSLFLCTSVWGQDSLNVRRVWQQPLPANAVILGSGLAYVAAGDEGLHIFDLTNPVAPTLISVCDSSWVEYIDGLAVQDSLVYIADDLGLWIADVSDPVHPAFIGHCLISGGWSSGVAVRGAYAYVSAWSSDAAIIDVHDPAHPAVVGQISLVGTGGITIRGQLAYFASSAALHIFDLADPLSPALVGTCSLPAHGNRVAVDGHLAYVAESTAGLQIVDIADSTTPVLIGSFDTPSLSAAVAVSGGFAFMANYWDGLRILNVTDPTAPVEVGFYDGPGWTHGVAVSGQYAYVAGDSAFNVYDCSAALGTSPSFILPPSSFRLSAYPSPFNATTQIRFDLPRASLVELRVYDLQGRIVENLASRMFAAGTHTLSYDASARASGMYVVQMTSGDYSTAQKVMLLK